MWQFSFSNVSVPWLLPGKIADDQLLSRRFLVEQPHFHCPPPWIKRRDNDFLAFVSNVLQSNVTQPRIPGFHYLTLPHYITKAKWKQIANSAINVLHLESTFLPNKSSSICGSPFYYSKMSMNLNMSFLSSIAATLYYLFSCLLTPTWYLHQCRPTASHPLGLQSCHPLCREYLLELFQHAWLCPQ